MTSIECSVCLVGAGVAGLVAAARLARLGHSVIMIEGGETQRAVAARSSEINHEPAAGVGGPRHRGLGGNSVLWAGKLLPLSAQDVQARSYLEIEGWPFAADEIERYRTDIETVMGLDHDSFEEDISQQLDPLALLPRHSDEFTLRWPKIPSAQNLDLGRVLRKDINHLDNLTIWTDATCNAFKVDSMNGRVMAISATSITGNVLIVRAKEYLITAGTLESTRLLLSLDRMLQEGLSGKGGVLGRFYNDHLGVNVASLNPKRRRATNHALADRYVKNSSRHLHFELSPAMQQQAAVSSAYFDIGVQLPDSSAMTAGKRLLRGPRGRGARLVFADMAAIARDLPVVASSANWRHVRKQKYWPADADIQMKFWIEQLPRWRNRLFLSDRRDALGSPQLEIEWSNSGEEEKTLDVMFVTAQRYWARFLSPLCGLSWKPEFLHPTASRAALATGLAHPAGSTRMGINPKTSVVDSHLKVHGIPNLSVASASVFPASGSANPTYTIMQLAMRAADALATRLPAA